MSISPKLPTALMQRFNIKEADFLGAGREARIYALPDNQVIKIFEAGNSTFLKALAEFYQRLNTFPLPYNTPHILEVGEADGVIFTIEKRLTGRALDQVFPSLSDEEKFRALENYFRAIKYYNDIQFSDEPYGQIVKAQSRLTTDSWPEFLLTRLEQRIQKQPRLAHDVLHFQQKVATFKNATTTYLSTEEKSLIHADYYFTNVMVDEQLNISAVLDFGSHAAVGDRRMDVAAVIDFLNISSNVTPDMKKFVRKLAQEQYGEDIDWFINFYALFYNFYFAATDDEELYQWALTGLNNEKAWVELKQR